MNTVPALLTSLSKSDIISSDFWASQFSSFTPANVLLVLISALITGIVISLVYRITYRGVLYSPQFSMVLIMLVLVTAPVVMAIGSNVALSMGMVGALSIVRFRTAIKEPLDTCYMFWAITMGILLGAKQYVIALVVVVGIGIILILLSFVRFRFSFSERKRMTEICPIGCINWEFYCLPPLWQCLSCIVFAGQSQILREAVSRGFFRQQW